MAGAEARRALRHSHGRATSDGDSDAVRSRESLAFCGRPSAAAAPSLPGPNFFLSPPDFAGHENVAASISQ